MRATPRDPADMSDDPKRFLRYLEAERNAALLYRALAQTTDGDRREALLELADIEEVHSKHWVTKLEERGVPVPPAPTKLDPNDARIVARARATGLSDVLAQLEAEEGANAGMYDAEPEAAPTMSEDEREHARVFASMRAHDEHAETTTGTPPHRVLSPGDGEPWHRGDRSGSLRAGVFGVSDGLVSNTALIMGFAGATAQGAGSESTVVLAGLAGLLAGAFSMAAGEYVSVASQRDLFQREIEIEAAELRDKPEEEQRELELIYRAKGLTREAAATTAAHIMQDPKIALDTLAREELGLDPDELGSPWKVAITSFITFTIGAFVPLLPYLLLKGTAAFVVSITLAVLALVTVGAVVGQLSGRGKVFSGMRQLVWGAGAAAVTYVVGSVIGVGVS